MSKSGGLRAAAFFAIGEEFALAMSQLRSTMSAPDQRKETEI